MMSVKKRRKDDDVQFRADKDWLLQSGGDGALLPVGVRGQGFLKGAGGL